MRKKLRFLTILYAVFFLFWEIPFSASATEVSTECPHLNKKTANFVEATCQHAGYSGDLVCVKCGEILSKGTVRPQLEHQFINGICVKCNAVDPSTTSEAPTDSPATEPLSTEPPIPESSSSEEVPSTEETGSEETTIKATESTDSTGETLKEPQQEEEPSSPFFNMLNLPEEVFIISLILGIGILIILFCLRKM